MCDISYILEQYTQTQAFKLFLGMAQCEGRHWPFYASLIHLLFCCVYCGASGPFDGFCFDSLSTCLVSDPFLKCKPFLEESPKSVQRPD